jgi:hypothetical protein
MSTTSPVARSEARRSTALVTLSALEEHATTCAPSASAARATAKPMPDVPPMTTTLAFASGAMIGGRGEE